MSEQKILTLKRGQLKAQLTRFMSYIDKVTNDNINELQIRMGSISDLLNEFNDIQLQIELLDDKEISNNERVEFEDKYYAALAKAHARLNEHGLVYSGKYTRVEKGSEALSASTTDGDSPTSVVYTSQKNVKLPTLDLPKFFGDYEDWTHFYETFSALVHNDSSIDEINKFYYLISCLKGDAAKTITAIEITRDNYRIAWDLLRERFENKEKITKTHIKALFDVPMITKESHVQLRRLIDNYTRHTRALKTLGEPVEHWSTLLMYLMCKKLDDNTKFKWEEYSSQVSKGQTVNIDYMIQFLTNRCNILENVEDIKNKSTRRDDRTVTSNVSFNKTKCFICSEDHPIYNCVKFKGLSTKEKYNEIKRLKLCANCLRNGHFANKCKSLSTCKKCGEKHNTLLHSAKQVEDGGEVSPKHTDGQSNQSSVQTLKATNKQQILLTTAIVQIKDGEGRWIRARALLDSGSQSNFITRDLTKRLKLHSYRVDLPVTGINQGITRITHGISTQIKSIYNNYISNLSLLVIDRISDDFPNFTINIEQIEIPKHLKLADPKFYESSTVELLLGAGIFMQLLSIGQVRLGEGLPILQKSILGWLISGPVIACHLSLNKANIQCNHSTNFGKLETQLEQFWTVEEIPTERNWSLEETKCEEMYENTTTRNEEGRFVVELPMRKKCEDLGDSLQSATKRFYKLEQKLIKNPDMYQTYKGFMEEYEELGHMSKVDVTMNSQNTTYYLPHHAVMKESSTTTKLRVVFDGSAKTTSNLSLNDLLMVGPTIQQDLVSILCRFREYNYVITADIAKMYRQVLINEHQRDLQRIVWRSNTDEPLQHYKLNTVTYGTAPASFLAIRSLHQIGYDIERDSPEISNIILKDFYVDDLLTGAHTTTQAKVIKDRLISILKLYGFELHKWRTNAKSDSRIEGDQNIEKQRLVKDSEAKTLGILWDSSNDVLKYEVKVHTAIETTKRTILSAISQIFDPLGLVSPTTIKAKLILQKLWQLQIEWDESIPEDLHTTWFQFCKGLSALNNIKIPRQAFLKNYDDLQVHGFCDASQIAYGACIYIRTSKGCQTRIALLTAKTRVAPLKKISLPRLELCGALLLAKLLEKTQRSLRCDIQHISLWCDSTIVLNWINSEPGRWQIFVANRVKQIKELTKVNQWRHVFSTENPADLASRGVNAEELMQSDLWWNGPKWLIKDPEHWPRNIMNKLKDIPEEKQNKQTFISTQKCDLFSKYSSLYKLQRVIAYCLRFYNVTKHKLTGFPSELAVDELSSALYKLISIAQSETFSQEIKCLKNGQNLPANSSILRLNPFLDNHLLRVGGRLTNCEYPYETKHPIILPQKHKLTYLIVREEHLRNLHMGPHALLASIRQRFWPVNGLNTIKHIFHTCITCYRCKPKDSMYQMGNLPQVRATETKPFEIVGIDFAGPFNIKDGKLKNRKIIKSYLSIFVCFTTKAVHLEVVGDLTTDSFLNALKRFTSRRGLCKHIYTDNGTNFVGANKLLKQLTSDNVKVKVYCAKNNMQWHFIPVRSPHFGGLWEAAVRCAKILFTRIIGNNILTFEELSTVFVQIESVLNSRPLTPISNHPDDLLALTPGHFLIGKPLNAIPQEDVLEIPNNRLKQYARLQQMFQHFWERWNKEYIHTLQQRTKWKQRFHNLLKAGTMVVIKDERLPPLQWKLGRVQETYPGGDGIIRTVKVKTTSGFTTISVTKVCALPMDDINS